MIVLKIIKDQNGMKPKYIEKCYLKFKPEYGINFVIVFEKRAFYKRLDSVLTDFDICIYTPQFQ